MAHAYSISESGLDLIKAYEGFRPVETVLVSGQKVIGYGHSYVRGEAALLTQQKAEDILKSDLEPIEKIINHIVFAPLSQNQFDALVSLAFNIGIDDFADSTVLHYLNNGQPLAAATGFDEWRKSIIADQAYVIDALVRRRTAEKALFLSPSTGIVTAPRYEIPVLHDSTVKSGADDIEVFIKSDDEGFVDQVPYEEPAQDRRSEDGPAGALMLSERAVAPQIYEDVLEANLVNETDSDEESDNAYVSADDSGADDNGGDDSVEDVIIDNIVEIKPDVEIEESIETELEDEIDSVAETEFEPESVEGLEDEAETEVEPEPVEGLEDEADTIQDEDLSPIALAAAGVSERLDNLMEETETETETIEPASLELNSVNEDEAPQEVVTIDELDVVETNILASEETNAIESDDLETDDLELGVVESGTEEAKLVEVEANNKPELQAAETVQKEKIKGTGAFLTALIIGLLLIGASLWKMKFSPTTNMGEMGAFLAPIVLLVGAMMIMGGMFYMVKAQLRSQTA
jgi:GH24 family phage-related lysozyme (muramidase)